MTQNGGFDTKWPNSCWVWTVAPGPFLLGLEIIHVYYKFHYPQIKHELGLVVLVIIGGTVDELGHIHKSLAEIYFRG